MPYASTQTDGKPKRVPPNTILLFHGPATDLRLTRLALRRVSGVRSNIPVTSASSSRESLSDGGVPGRGATQPIGPYRVLRGRSAPPDPAGRSQQPAAIKAREHSEARPKTVNDPSPNHLRSRGNAGKRTASGRQDDRCAPSVFHGHAAPVACSGLTCAAESNMYRPAHTVRRSGHLPGGGRPGKAGVLMTGPEIRESVTAGGAARVDRAFAVGVLGPGHPCGDDAARPAGKRAVRYQRPAQPVGRRRRDRHGHGQWGTALSVWR